MSMNYVAKQVLWQILTKKAAYLKANVPHNGWSQRSQGWVDESQEKMRLTLSLGQEDGTSRVFVLTAVVGGTHVTVKEYQDNLDEFWGEQLKHLDNSVRINAEHYRIGNEGVTCKGYDGKKFYLRNLATGAVIHTTNLSYQGKIPPKHRHALPDNYEFVNTFE